MKNRYRNPWHNVNSRTRPEFYENNAPCVYEYRGVKVFKIAPDAVDYVFEGCAITQRGGFDRKVAKIVVDDILDGKIPVADTVADHLRKHGFKPMTLRWNKKKNAADTSRRRPGTNELRTKRIKP